jgi:hypothetical protein
MHLIGRNALCLVALAALTTLGACSSDSGTSSLLPSPDAVLKRPDWASFSGAKSEFTLRPVTNEDLVNAEGQCAFAAAEQAGGPSDAVGPQGAAQAPAGVALQMTECDVVRRAGTPERVEIGADERGDRSAILTYTRGPLPGVYRFTGGRLAAVERAPGAPATAKPQKSPKAAKKTAA